MAATGGSINLTQVTSVAALSRTRNNSLSGMISSAGVKRRGEMCGVCGITFNVPARLTRHYRTHTGERPFECEVCGKNFAVKENLNVHRRIHTKEKPYGCPYCGRGFEHSGKLQRHIRIHTGERPHKCPDCGKTFIQSGQLIIHIRSHTGEKPYVCAACAKGFTCSKQLKVHSRTHTGERPYVCDMCGKAFAYNHVLKLHQMIHLVERLYKCNLCAETYSSKKTLDEHLKTHGLSHKSHQPTRSQKHFGAEVASSSASTPSSLLISLPFEKKMVIQSDQIDISGSPYHTGKKTFACIVCNKGFASSKQLTVHSRSHTGERPFTCGLCGKSFAYNHVLKLHEKVHLVERLYKCNLCAETYTSKKTLDKHIKSHGLSLSLQSTTSQHLSSSELAPYSASTSSSSNIPMIHNHNSDLTNSRPMPPLIPIAAICSTSMVQSKRHGSIHFQQQFLVSALSPQIHEERDVKVYGPRKRSRLLKSNQEVGKSNSAGSEFYLSTLPSASSSPPPPLTFAYGSAFSAPEIIFDQTLRFSSVIRFAQRPDAAGSS